MSTPTSYKCAQYVLGLFKTKKKIEKHNTVSVALTSWISSIKGMAMIPLVLGTEMVN